jgi:hypothetical protein
MISTIEGLVKQDVHFTEAIKATFPMGSMTGAPKKRVMELMDQYETAARGLFAGSIGYITPEADFDFNVDNKVSGTVFDSVGKPMTKACLEMFPIQGEKPKSYDLYDCVDENGFFKFDEIPPGNYVISVKIESSEPIKKKSK